MLCHVQRFRRLRVENNFCSAIQRFFFLQEIEDLVSEKLVEVISSRSEVGELRQKCDAYRVTHLVKLQKLEGLSSSTWQPRDHLMQHLRVYVQLN